LRKFASLGASLAIAFAYVALMASPASAAHHHHHHHHHHGGGGGGGVVCGPGTSLVGGVCVPNPTGPVGNSNVHITPDNVTMTLDGTFATSAIVSGLPPLTAITAVAVACNGTGEVIVNFLNSATTDALGRIGDSIQSVGGAGSCVPGTYPLTFKEVASPFQTFVGFLTIHF
jgi:hypothetical protein